MIFLPSGVKNEELTTVGIFVGDGKIEVGSNGKRFTDGRFAERADGPQEFELTAITGAFIAM